ncbi:MAG: S8 family serine peptidase [Elusimicrobia bacterium]|nr:S8 family serine peptidase [Elusimicrobiota bacterium]
MKRFKALIALALSLALVLLSPGTGAYNAAAQTMTGAVSGSAASGASGAVGSNLGVNSGVNAIPVLSASALTLSPVLVAPSIAPAALQGVAVIPAASVAPAAVSATPSAAIATPAAAKAAAVPGVKAVAAAVATLRSNLSAPSASEKPAETQAAEARKQFDGEALKTDLSAPSVSGDEVQSRGSALRSSSKKDKGTPEEPVDDLGNPVKNDGPIDDLGNPSRRGGEGGPDDRTDPDHNDRGGNSGLFGMAAMGFAAGGVAAGAMLTLGSLAVFPMIILSLVLHEIGHARTADKLGDPTARMSTYRTIDWSRLRETRLIMPNGSGALLPRLYIPQQTKSADRASLNPLTWGSHIDPVMTILVPLLTFLTMGFIIGGARPVPFEPSYFKNPVRDSAIVALAGPAVNFGLAAAGALAVTGAIAAGLGAGVVAGLVMFSFLNALLGIWNLIPIPGFDGSHILSAMLPERARAGFQSYIDRSGAGGMLLPMIILFYFGGAYIAAAAMFITKLMIGGVMAVTGVKLASAFLPAVAAMGLAVGSLAPGDKAPAAQAPATGPANPGNGGAASSGGAGPVDLIVMFGEKQTKLHDAHISNVDVNLPNGVEQYTRLQQAMLAQLETAGLDSAALEPYKATPLATYARINAATIRVDGGAAAEFAKLMTERGFTVHKNAERKIIRPVPTMPETMDPSARGAVTMDENLKIVKADLVQAEAVKMWGKPELGFWSGLWAKVFKSAPVQPKFGVIDSGADTSHPLLKRVKEVKNMTSGANVDDIGHGSWVTSTVLHMAPWSRNTTHYKTFLNGSATTDDILKSLTQAGNDGNLVISNSWGDDEGDPNGPDAQLVKKLASEGHIMVFAAGNAGSGANTIGAPAIVTYKDAKTGAIRVIAVAASDKTKKAAYFSSRGPGSPTTKKDPNYKDQRPDAMAVGHNIEGAWPAGLGDADRTDGEKGTVKAISGTSMSTPGFAGAIALLVMMFGVTEKGDKLDAIVNAVMATLEKTGQGPNVEGQGFLNLDAAYKKLQAQFTAVPADVASYRAKKSRLYTVDRFISMSASWRYGVMINADEFSRAVAEKSRLIDEIDAMDSADKTLAYRAAGPVKRLILNATGAAPKP